MVELYVTHSGSFHPDEVVGGAIVKRRYPNIRFVRTRDKTALERFKRDRNVIVSDVGGEYNPYMNNYDHHQDVENLPSSAGMIFDNFFDLTLSDKELRGVNRDRFKSLMYRNLIKYFDNVDRHDSKLFSKLKNFTSQFEYTIPLLHAQIKKFNRNPANPKEQMRQFVKAVNFASDVIENEINDTVNILKSEESWDARKVLSDEVIIIENPCKIWRHKIRKQKLSYKYVVQPNMQGWSVNTVNSDTHPIPKLDNPDLVYYHENRFLAVLRTKKAAIDYALSLPNSQNE